MKQMSFCEEDCEIRRTLARTSAVVENVRPTTSGNPTIPGPPTLINVTSRMAVRDRKSTRLNSSHDQISYAVFCLKKKNQDQFPQAKISNQSPQRGIER